MIVTIVRLPPMLYSTAASVNSMYQPVPPMNNYFEAHSDRKFNVVMFGIEESAPGSAKLDRMENDLGKLTSIITSLDDSIPPSSIRDHFRLGKFKQDQARPRPILVKLNRTSEVNSILSKKKNLSNSLRIKPDLSPPERLKESTLLKERWCLIQAGTSRKDIKIVGSSLFVNRKHVGVFRDGEFVKTRCDDATPSPSPAPSTTTEPTVPVSSHHALATPTPSLSPVSPKHTLPAVDYDPSS